MSRQKYFFNIYNLYMCNRNVLKDWSFIISTQYEGSINLYAGMEEIEGVPYRLFTPFANGKVNIINDRIAKRYMWKNDPRAKTKRYVSFDTQTVSYIEEYYKNGTVPYKGFDSVVKVLNGTNFEFDGSPYILENLMFDTSRKKSVEQNLYAFEMLCRENAGNEKFCRKRAHAIVSLFEKKKFVVPFRAKELYKMIYLALIKMSQIQLAYNDLPVNDKLNLFIEFMATKICKMMSPEINLAKLYFTKGNSCGFFGKVQQGNIKILDQLKNMAWDLLHIRFLNYSSTMFNAKEADAIIPYFFTYDKRLQDIRECYALQTLAVNPKNNSVIPIYVLQAEEAADIIEDYVTYEKFKARMNSVVDLDLLIEEAERELMGLI